MVKFLFCGKIETMETFNCMLKKVEKLQTSKHGPFDAIFCIHPILPMNQEESLKTFPLPMYYLNYSEVSSTLDSSQFPMLNKFNEYGIQKINGLNVAYVSSMDLKMEKVDEIHSYWMEWKKNHETEIIDIFLTYEIPSQLEMFIAKDTLPEEFQKYNGSKPLCHLLKFLQPRYHICGDANIFYQRLPYRPSTDSTYITRMISLASVSSSTEKCKKWIHALQLNLFDPNDPKNIPNIYTENPFMESSLQSKRKQSNDFSDLNKSNSSISTFKRFRIEEKKSKHENIPKHMDKYQNTQRRKDCWFCLSTPNFETHLVVSVGQEAYMALPKGSLISDHVLIVPIVHESSLVHLSTSTQSEIQKYVEAMKLYCKERNKGCVVMERFGQTQGVSHGHLQVIPIPQNKVSFVQSAFLNAENDSIEWIDLDKQNRTLEEIVEMNSYFYIEIPIMTEDSSIIYKHYVTTPAPNSIQFGRWIVANVLGLRQRGDWKKCIQPLKQEKILVEKFKSQFSSFDFTL